MTLVCRLNIVETASGDVHTGGKIQGMQIILLCFQTTEVCKTIIGFFESPITKA